MPETAASLRRQLHPAVYAEVMRHARGQAAKVTVVNRYRAEVRK